MKIKKANVFNESHLDAICITTNGFIKRGNRATVGRGIAKTCNELCEGFDLKLGSYILTNGHCVDVIMKYKGFDIISFPTKPSTFTPESKDDILPQYGHFIGRSSLPGFMAKSDMKLIEKSLKELVELTNQKEYNNVGLPIPGIGCGELNKEDVIVLCRKYLDDRFTLYYL